MPIDHYYAESVADRQEPSSSKGERALAAVGVMWIPVVWFLVVGAGGVPPAWRWALSFYGAYGLLECTATLSDKRNTWASGLSVVRYASLAAVGAAFVYVMVTNA